MTSRQSRDITVKNLALLIVSCSLAACATNEPRLQSQDEHLESEAQRYELLARAADDAHSPDAARAYREKAVQYRAAKKVQPSLGDHLFNATFDALIDALFSALDKKGK